MTALANVSLQSTYLDWMTKLNQVVAKGNEQEIFLVSAYNQSNNSYNASSIAFPRANLAFYQANQAFAQANTGGSWTLSAYGTANIAFHQANIAFSGANTGQTAAVAAFTRSNSAFYQANLAYAAANAATSSASASAFYQANQAFAIANTKMSANNPANLSTFTTDAWGVPIKLDQGKTIQWTKTGTTHAYGLGFTSNNGLHVFTSSSEDNTGLPNYFLRVSPNTFTYKSQTVWHSGNDGSGTGLDADQLDGYHASSFLLTSNYTASDVLSKISTVDGVGSGLDADLLDGHQSSDFLLTSDYTASDVLSKILSVDGSESGLDADKLQGATPSMSSVAYSIGQRDGNGDFTARYLSSSDTSVGSGVTGVMVKAGDSSYKTASSGAILSFLSLGTGSSAQYNSLGIGTAASGTSGEIRATNNITAYYSDARLKMIEGNIDNAIDKIMLLSGIYYRNNSIAKSYGYTDDERQVGVIAQQVQRVLPEAIAPAPFDTKPDKNGNLKSISGENYLTVRMERLIPLLIEGMKEQEVKIRQLQEIVSMLQGDRIL